MSSLTAIPRKVIVIIIAIVVVIVLVGAVILLVWQGTKFPASSTKNTETSPILTQLTSEVVTSDEAEFSLASGDVTVRIPAWYLKIVLRDPNLFPEAGEPGWQRPKIVNVEAFNADDTRIADMFFNEPIDICFKLTTEQWEHYQASPEDFQVQIYAAGEKPSVWQELAVADAEETQSLCGKTQGLSLFALAVYDPEPATQEPDDDAPYSP